MNRIFSLLLILFFSVSLFGQKDLDRKLKELDAYYEQALADWNVPGMAVAIVKDGEIVFSKGYGTLNINTGEPVDGNSLFAIASNTKAFTATALAMLADEGKLSWNDRVRDYLPWFELYDPYVSDNFTIRDLLTHRSGLKTFSGDLIWYGTNLGREEVVRNARYLEPTFGFRSGYGYSNIMYIAAGLVIEKVTGENWDDFIRERILDPLHMDRTLSSTEAIPGMDNVSSPHNDVKDSIITIEWLNWDNVAPAGAIISSVNDISKWLIFNMNRGITADGDTLLSAGRFDEMWAAVNPQGVSSWSMQQWPSTHFKAYGLGWAMFDYHGRKVLGHGGGYDGFISNTTFVPEDELGMVFLTNKNTSLYYPLKFKTLDVMLDAGLDTDWSKDFLTMMEQRNEYSEKAKAKAEEERVKDSRPTLPIEDYLGTYNCKMYGDARVYFEGTQLMVHLLPTEIFVGTLDHWQYNTWKIEMKDVPALPPGLVNFIIDQEGKVVEMKIDIPNPDFYFDELKFLKIR
ncbi:MAG: serine hydrolase [Bacteroidales bacterium]|jgi:CubicO group peptidase (beta-lactamase class C family)|nr:serine hydrolase [Bacteroidales bacterium]